MRCCVDAPPAAVRSSIAPMPPPPRPTRSSWTIDRHDDLSSAILPALPSDTRRCGHSTSVECVSLEGASRSAPPAVAAAVSASAESCGSLPWPAFSFGATSCRLRSSRSHSDATSMRHTDQVARPRRPVDLVDQRADSIRFRPRTSADRRAFGRRDLNSFTARRDPLDLSCAADASPECTGEVSPHCRLLAALHATVMLCASCWLSEPLRRRVSSLMRELRLSEHPRSPSRARRGSSRLIRQIQSTDASSRVRTTGRLRAVTAGGPDAA